jgi:hypothetical protein
MIIWGKVIMIIGQHRDSETIEVSNFRVALKMLGGESKRVIIVRALHWAVGWVESIMVHKTALKKIEIGQGIADKLEDYPILDDDDYQELEMEELEEAWNTWGFNDCLAPIEKIISPLLYRGWLKDCIKDIRIKNKINSLVYMEVFKGDNSTNEIYHWTEKGDHGDMVTSIMGIYGKRITGWIEKEKTHE